MTSSLRWRAHVFFGILTVTLHAQPVVLENQVYRLEVSPEAVVVSRIDAPGIVRRIRSELTLQFSAQDPQYVGGPSIAWKPDGKKRTRDFWKIGTLSVCKATAVARHNPRSVELAFPPATAGRLTLVISLAEGRAPPAFRWQLTATHGGWFSVGFTGLESQDPAKLDFLYLPLIWSWKRFPGAPALTPESYATTALSFVNSAGASEGVAPDVTEIPYRFATFENSRFGLALRDEAGRARPVLFAPILGGAESRLAAGEARAFTVRYLLQPGDWYAGLTHFYREVAGYRNERQNATCSLNETFENMVDYAMNDTYGGWIEELKAHDYRFDVPSAVKNVAASSVLSVALTTGNLEIYRRRGLPILEYLLSREKYLYAQDESITYQSPSHFLRGPAVELGELAALHQLTGGRDSVYARETARLFGRPRRLNLTTETGGASWQDYLARYRIDGNPADLRAAREGADRYVAEAVAKYPADFLGSAGLRDPEAGFVTDYTPKLYDLFELYEETREQRYLEAAMLSARQFLLWQRSQPMAPTATIVANPGGTVPGVFPGRRQGKDSGFTAYDTSTAIPEQRVPAWRTSLVGLPPEASGTYLYGPVMLAHHAAWFLRLAHLGADPLLAAAASNAVIGRYANFPGYYFTSLATTVYQPADYPLRPYLDVKYNAIFYNHIWPHIALLQDYLVSEAYAKSRGRVHFPSAYAPGYAFLTSKVYGHRPGEIFGDSGVRLWLPPRALRTSAVAVNHLFGVGADATYLVLSNTSAAEVADVVALDADVLRLDAGVTYRLTCFRPDGTNEKSEMRDGRFGVRVAAEGLLAVKIHGLRNGAALPQLTTGSAPAPVGEPNDFFRQSNGGATGTVTGMILRFGAHTDAFIYTDATEKQACKVTLHYRSGTAPEVAIEDVRYPFEFSLPLAGDSPLFLRLAVEDFANVVSEVNLPALRARP